MTAVAPQDGVLDWRHRVFPSTRESVAITDIVQQGWNVLSGDLLLPVLVLKESALEHNVQTMRRFCDRHGVDLAPHGKTTMSPEIVARQLRAGAWAITAATVQQARALRAFGVERILIANEVIDPQSLRWIVRERDRDAQFDCWCLVDSVAAVERMAEALDGEPIGRPIGVLIELGVTGGRTGARNQRTAVRVAQAVAAAPSLRLAGIEAFEGVIGASSLEASLGAVDKFLARLRALAISLAEQGFFDGLDEVLVTAGGSAYFDRVVEALGGVELGRSTRLVLRSGCYVTHDSGFYRQLSPLDNRLRDGERLRPALEAWGVVISRPEPNLALVGLGKRDVPYDLGMPLPEQVRRRSGALEPLAGATVVALNDQHAFVHLDGAELEVGDWLGCGISHPCTAFDKWRAIPIVSDGYDVTEVARTYF